MIHRRRLLAMMVAAPAAMRSTALRAEAARRHHVQLTAGPGAQRLDPELPADTATWSYNGRVPGPVIRVTRGDELTVVLNNRLEQGTAIHWHGLRIDNAMDGVVGLTQPSVMPGESFEYRFRVPDAGTYWYHAHQNSTEQVGRGLYGVLLVDEAGPAPADREVVLALDDWRLDDAGAIHSSFSNLHDIAHGGRLGNWLTVNGRGSETIDARPGERLRLRILNTANSLIMPLRMPRWRHWVLALDGMPLAEPVRPDSDLVLGPGQRVDVVIDVPADSADPADIAFTDRGGVIPLIGLVPAGKPVQSGWPSPPLPLSPNPVRLPADAPDGSVELVMRGGAMGDLDAATHEGQMMNIRELVRRGKAWALNGVVDRTDQPLFRATRGSVRRIVMRNDTAWPHAMHIHGHHFLVEDPDLAEAGPVLRDTVLVPPGKTLPIRFVADNPGKWLLHCHMLEHQAGGMVTWFEVT